MSTPLTFQNFRMQFDTIVDETNPSWEAVGFIAPDDFVYAFGTDSKVLSTVFEALSGPLVGQIAEQSGYKVEGSPQTVYPDFTLTPTWQTPSLTNPCRIAIDIKTTYRKFKKSGGIQQFRYTLGSYTSYLREPTATKNIKYPYAEYSEHWVIGFLYTRRDGVPAKVYKRPDVDSLLCPYQDVDYFIQEKYKVVGEAAGSGNTANIGSFPTTDIQQLKDGLGPFADHGKEICDDYWRNYGRTARDREFNSVAEFLQWQDLS